MLLKGVKILELANFIPGPMCSLFLADLGADVIKIESLTGDPMRDFEARKNKSPYFSALNRGKGSMALNLKTEEGKKIFMELAKDADVIIEGFRPGKFDALGIGYIDVKKINPKIIYCSITGYGQKGINENKAGHDLNYASASGMLDVISKKPFVPRIQIADTSSALIAALSIIAALFYREKSGKGNYIDVPIIDCVLSFIGPQIAKRSASKDFAGALSGNMPCYNIYETKDKRFVSLGALENKFWVSFCKAAKRSDLASKQFDGNLATIKKIKVLFKSKTLEQWAKLNKKYDFCCEPVKKIDEISKGLGLNKGILINLDSLKQIAMPAVFSSFESKYSKSPKLGEQTKGLLSNLGYSNKSIKGLVSRNVVL